MPVLPQTPAAAARPRPRNAPAMAPAHLGLHTIVPPGMRMSARLRAFFVAHAGPAFHFNQALRDFFRAPAGRSLGDALALYHHSAEQATPTIAAQFEYNRHMRAYFDTHPQATMPEARQAWWALRAARKTP